MNVLAGMRVVDFGQGVAGPYCGTLLGDFGADVIKVEPFRGDWSRSMGSRIGPTDTTTSISVNRNKRSVAIDLAKEAGKNIARKLALSSDVLIESFRPTVMERLGLGYDSLILLNPELIYCSVTGYGASGPYAELPAGDSTTQGVGGLMSIVGEAGGGPLRVGNVVSDMLAGMHCFEAVLLSTIGRTKTGKGGRVQINLLETMLAFQAAPLTEFLHTGVQADRTGNAHPLVCPSGAIKSTDGMVTFTVLHHQWPAFCKFLGMPELIEDVRFATNELRIAHRTDLMGIVQSRFITLDKATALDRLRKADVLCAPVNSYADLVEDPQVKHNHSFRSVTHPVLGKMPVIANPIHIDGQSFEPAAAPRLGEHTYAVLSKDLSLADAEIETLASDGAIYLAP
jgi:crotonobetainyl-CoA:carnitine CoA-transferase CaiB-like acyl-CoA transferase